MAEDVRRSAESIRRPELELEVIWQRHIPQGTGESESDERVDAVADMTLHLEQALDGLGVYDDLLDSADLVFTISKRPM